MAHATAEEKRTLDQVFAHATATADTMILKWAVRLELADIIHAHAKQNPEGITLAKLAKSLPFKPVHIQNLGRIMRYMVHMGLFSKSTNSQGQDLFKPANASELILKDGKKSILSFIIPIIDEWFWAPWNCLDVALDGNNKNFTPFEKKHGCNLWEALSKLPERGKMFDASLAAETMALIPGVIKVSEGIFQRIGSIVDVGGGAGIAASSIAAAFPHVKCSVLDLPEMVARIVDCPKNVEWVPGDMFTSIPHADALLLKKILHDWGDDECVKILQRCKEALPKGGMLIIVEYVMDSENNGDDGWERQRMFSDLAMMVLVAGGKERTAAEWKVLLSSAGFDIYKVTPIMMGYFVILAQAHPFP